MSEPTLYEYYTAGGIKSGLQDNKENFTLNGKNISLYSGAFHYFRVHPQHWRDRLRKMRACGLNAVETYIPWNLHEPEKNTYDFGNRSKDMSIFLDITRFIKTAEEEDLFVIIRPGPYICAEWEFGGLPSYLLRYKNIKIRTSDKVFLERVQKYFQRLFDILAPLQFTKNGPIIAFQIENEYGNVKEEGVPIDTNYLLSIKRMMLNDGIVEMLFTSDTPSNGFHGTLPDVLATANFQENPEEELALLKKFQPKKPLMVMEFWTGWFDHWTDKHETRSPKLFSSVLEKILELNSSVNFYMFHGGTNWGFLNGANNFKDGYQPDVSSYDYDAPLSEAGDCTEKYYLAKKIIERFNKVATKLPIVPNPKIKVRYNSVEITCELNLNELISQSLSLPKFENVIPMEMLSINNDSGQSYGYIIYRKSNLNIPPKSVLQVRGHIRDFALVLINGILVSKPLESKEDFNNFGYWKLDNSHLEFNNDEKYSNCTLDIVVGNWGRLNYGALKDFDQRKGLVDCKVSIGETILLDWDIIPLEFKSKWTLNLTNWNPIQSTLGPTLYKGNLWIDEENDTFIDMRDWHQGIVVVNGFVLSRYCNLGPQQTCYLPEAFLNKGNNSVFIFEHFRPSNLIKFIDSPILS